MARKKVLLIGIDPKLIDPNLSTATGWDANRVRAAAQDANKRLVELGYKLQSCLDPRGTDESVVSDTLSREKFDSIMVGVGVRVLSQNTIVFEKIMNTIHQKAPPSSKICFNTILLTLLKRSSVGLIVTLKKSYIEKLTVHLIGYC